MISHDHRCIFVHIPKTAGNSVNRVFDVGWQDHKDLQRYHDELTADEFASYFKFAIVRNPWDRLFSDYNYQLKKGRDKDSKLFLFTPTGTKRNFAEWIEVALAEPDFYDPSRWGGAVSSHIHRWSPQRDWLSVDGRPAVDFIARLERLSEDFPVICRRVGIPTVRLPHRNRRLHLHYSHYYDASTRNVVANYYARDIELFGYEFRHSFLRVSFSWPKARVAPADDNSFPSAHPDEHSSNRAQALPLPGPMRSTTAYAWLVRYSLALAASLTIFVRTFSALPTTDPLAEAGHISAPQEFFRQTVRQAAIGDFDTSAALAVPVASATRASHTLHQLKFTFEPSPSTFMGFVPLVVSNLPATPTSASQRRSAAAASVDVRSASGRAPRWWWNRNNEDSFP